METPFLTFDLIHGMHSTVSYWQKTVRKIPLFSATLLADQTYLIKYRSINKWAFNVKCDMVFTLVEIWFPFGWDIKPQRALVVVAVVFLEKTNCLRWYKFLCLGSQQHVMQSNMCTIYKKHPHTIHALGEKKYLLTAHREFEMAIYRAK